jgi:hypothetical protein
MTKRKHVYSKYGLRCRWQWHADLEDWMMDNTLVTLLVTWLLGSGLAGIALVIWNLA